MSNLIKCSDCGKEVSKNASACPHCGNPISVDEIAGKPKCPNCKSTNIKKISLRNKIGSAALIGVFSIGHISKTFKCNNCGYKW